jgi:hypothetical protein
VSFGLDACQNFEKNEEGSGGDQPHRRFFITGTEKHCFARYITKKWAIPFYPKNFFAIFGLYRVY